MNSLTIIQARLHSARLPFKALYPLQGLASLKHTIERAKKIKTNAHVLAIPNTEHEKHLTTMFENDIHIETGNEQNLLKRFFEITKTFKPDTIVRITGDCPLIAFDQANLMLQEMRLRKETKYISNSFPRRQIKGLDFEIFRTELLEEAYFHSTNPHEQIHVTPWMQKRLMPNEIQICEKIFVGDSERSLALDTIEDYKKLTKIFNRLPFPAYELLTSQVVSSLKEISA